VVDVLDVIEIEPETSEPKAEQPETLKIINEAENTDNTVEEKIKPEEIVIEDVSKPEEALVPPAEKKIIDINIKSIDDIITLQIDNEYDFTTIEPGEDEVKISFKKDKIEKDVRYVKFPTYNTILVQIKQATKLKVEISQTDQEGKGTKTIKTKTFNLLAKTVPGSFGERVFLKAKLAPKKEGDAKAKKAPIGKILGFLGAASFVSLIL